MSAFASVRERMVAAGMVDGATGLLTPAGIAEVNRIIAELKVAPPPPDGDRPHPGARLPGIRWNTNRKGRRNG